MSVEVDVSEVYRLVAELNAAGVKVGRLSEETLEDVAQECEADAKSLAPQGPTGNLKRSIGTIGSGEWRRVQSTIRYATFVEFGTYKDAPQPFMWPAADRAEGRMFAEFAKLGDPFI